MTEDRTSELGTADLPNSWAYAAKGSYHTWPTISLAVV